MLTPTRRIMGLDGQYHTMPSADFHIAMTDMLKAGFPVANTGKTFHAMERLLAHRTGVTGYR